MNIGVFGSCLSADPAWFLKHHYDATEKIRIFHNRSDQFIKYYIDSSPFPHRIASAEGLRPDVDKEKAAKDIIFNQLPESIGCEGPLAETAAIAKKLEDRIAEASLDLVLIDNFMDIVAKLAYDPEKPDEKLFFPLHFRKDRSTSRYLLDDTLTPADSALNFSRITRYFKKFNPNTKIFFTCWPLATSRQNEERYNRIADFFRHFSALTKNDDLAIIPPLDLESEFTNGEDDWYHLSKRMYKSIAGSAFLYYSAGIKPDADSYRLPFFLSARNKNNQLQRRQLPINSIQAQSAISGGDKR